MIISTNIFEDSEEVNLDEEPEELRFYMGNDMVEVSIETNGVIHRNVKVNRDEFIQICRMIGNL